MFKEYSNELSARDKLEIDVTQVELLILSTIKHEIHPNAQTLICSIFLDLDLEVLSRNPTEYQIYTRQIRNEYLHYPEDGFNKGRVEVLKRLLNNDRLYHHRDIMNEHQARHNILQEIYHLDNDNKSI